MDQKRGSISTDPNLCQNKREIIITVLFRLIWQETRVLPSVGNHIFVVIFRYSVGKAMRQRDLYDMRLYPVNYLAIPS